MTRQIQYTAYTTGGGGEKQITGRGVIFAMAEGRVAGRAGDGRGSSTTSLCPGRTGTCPGAVV